MMQTVTSTTLRMENFVYKDLGSLLYGPNIRRFNMFFLDSLDLNRVNVLSEARISATDEAFVHHRLGLASKAKAPKKMNGVQLAAAEDLGLSGKVTWAVIQQTLETSPHRLIRHYTWPAHLTVYLNGKEDSLRSDAVKLFILLTQSLWTLLKSSFKLNPNKLLQVHTLQDAIQFWSLDNILAELRSPHLQPISTKETGISGRHRADFGSVEQVVLFFSIRKGGGWQCLSMTVGMAYAKAVITHPGAKKEKQLQAYLGELLSACQCFPDSNQARVWNFKQDQIIVNSNPKHWTVDAGEITERGAVSGTSNRQGPVHKGQKDFLEDMLRLKDPDILAVQISETYNTWMAKTQNTVLSPQIDARNKTSSHHEKQKVTHPRRKVALKSRKFDDADWSPGDLSDNTE
jgi:hypothetical protein